MPDINITTQLPGESIITKALEFILRIRDGMSEDEFVAMREARDRTLDMPKLIVPSLQVNIRAGHLPEAEDNGTRYLKVPINKL